MTRDKQPFKNVLNQKFTTQISLHKDNTNLTKMSNLNDGFRNQVKS